jgi:hypothetical protein
VPIKQRQFRSGDDLASDLARYFIRAEPSSRIATIRELAQQEGTSIASIHQAIARLESAGAVEIDRRSNQGSFLYARSLGRLWAIAADGPLVVALPLAGSRRYEALATAIKTTLSSAGLDVYLIFVRGSSERLRALRERRCHLAVMSAFAASELCGHGESCILELPPDSFNTGHRVFYADDRPLNGALRVLVEVDSVDQRSITMLEFEGMGSEFVPARGFEFATLLETGHGDAAVWTTDEMEIRRPVGIRDRALSDDVSARVGDRDRRAAVVARISDVDVLASIVRVIEPGEFMRVQTEVVAGRMVPQY